jgi:hypothetical protein
MPVRGVYKKTDRDSRQRVLRSAEVGGDWKAVAEAHDIPYHTAYTWLQNDSRPLKARGGD